MTTTSCNFLLPLTNNIGSSMNFETIQCIAKKLGFLRLQTRKRSLLYFMFCMFFCSGSEFYLICILKRCFFVIFLASGMNHLIIIINCQTRPHEWRGFERLIHPRSRNWSGSVDKLWVDVMTNKLGDFGKSKSSYLHSYWDPIIDS